MIWSLRYRTFWLQDLSGTTRSSLNWIPVRGVWRPKGTIFSTLTTPAPTKHLQDFLADEQPETDTGNVATLTNFIKWAVNKHGNPDVRYLLILSGHGSGITEDFFLADADSMDSLTINELEAALDDKKVRDVLKEKNNDQPKKIDILGMDACYMAMGEIAYQIQDNVDILVGAEGLEAEFGWPYGRILARAKEYFANNNQSMDPETLADMIVREYVNNYSDYDGAAGRSSDLTAIRLSGIEKVAESLQKLTNVLKILSAEDHKKLLLAHWYAQTYKFDQYVDLKDLCSTDSGGVPRPEQ